MYISLFGSAPNTKNAALICCVRPKSSPLPRARIYNIPAAVGSASDELPFFGLTGQQCSDDVPHSYPKSRKKEGFSAYCDLYSLFSRNEGYVSQQKWDFWGKTGFEK